MKLRFALIVILLLYLFSIQAKAQATQDWEHYLNALFLPIGSTKATSEVAKIEDANLKILAQNAQNISPANSSLTLETVAKKESNRKKEMSDSELAPASSVAMTEEDVTAYILPIQLLPELIEANEQNADKHELKGLYTRYKNEFNLHASAYLYAKNVIASLPNKAIIVTQGQLDTYPIIINQTLENFRKDVVVINLSWLTSPKYRKSIEQQIGGNCGWTDADKTTVLLNKLLSTFPERTFVSMTISQNLLSGIQTQLKPHGLTFSISQSNIQNHHRTLELFDWEKVINGNAPEYIKSLNSNYLAALLLDEKMQSPPTIGKYERAKLLTELYNQTGLKSKAENYLNK